MKRPTRYRVVVLTSWGRPYRNSLGKLPQYGSGVWLDLTEGLRYHFRNPEMQGEGAGELFL